MRRMIGMLGLAGLMAAAGCGHIGGKCDCGPSPGDAAMYAPYHAGYGRPVPPPAPIAVESIPAPVKEVAPPAAAVEIRPMPRGM
jgi:hypothetical protein